MSILNLASYIDHTLLRPDATSKEIKILCSEAIEKRFACVCVNGCHVQLANGILREYEIPVGSVVGFPLGASVSTTKVFEMATAIDDGASEIDVVMNLGWFKNKDYRKVASELRIMRAVAGSNVLKIIIETCYLDRREKLDACKLCRDAGADFVKTSTGFGPGGASVEDVGLLKEAAGSAIKIKAAGGIKTREFAEALISAGADRLGTSSSIAILRGV